MTVSIKHAFTSPKSDGADATLVQPSNWNAEHTLTAAAGKVLGRDTSGAGVVQELPIAVDSSGNVSIAGNFATDGNATFGNASGDTVTINAGTVSVPNGVNLSGGNVGIGTGSPLGRFTSERAAASAGWVLAGRSTGIANESGVYIDASNNAEFAARNGSGTLTVRIGSSGDSYINGGNVGIGTSSPGALFEARKDQNAVTNIKVNNVNTGAAAQARFDMATGTANSFAILTLQDNAGSPYVVLGSGSAVTGAYYDMNIHIFRNQAGTERLRITNTGRVGIGTNNPAGLLDVSGGDTFLRNTTYLGASGVQNIAADATTLFLRGGQFAFQNAGATTTYFQIDATNYTLNSLPTYNNTAAGSTVVVTSTGAIRRTSSSIKYKKDVENLDPALTTRAISNLRPVWYRTKNAEGDDKPTWSHIGLIAEEVHEVEPRLVRYRTATVEEVQKPVLDEAGGPVLADEGSPTFTTEQQVRDLAVPEPEDVDYARLSVLLLQEVQSLRERVAALEARP